MQRSQSTLAQQIVVLTATILCLLFTRYSLFPSSVGIVVIFVLKLVQINSIRIKSECVVFELNAKYLE